MVEPPSSRLSVAGPAPTASTRPAPTASAGSAPTAPTASAGFGDRLAARVAERESQIVLGLDPDPARLWPPADLLDGGTAPAGADVHDGVHDGETGERLASRRAPTASLVADAVVVHCRALIDAAGPACVAVKPQLARFELLGAPGWAALATVAAHARDAGLLVIADGKRGDIDVSAHAYARALMRAPYGGMSAPHGEADALDADMVTVNPLMGADALAPFVDVAREQNAGVLVLVRTSNPGAADIEDLALAGGGAVWERIAALVAELGAGHVGDSGLSDVGAVVGATVPAHLQRARELMPNAVFLLPGVGAQGGRVEDLAAAFAPGRAGGLIAASRSIAQAHLAPGGVDDPPSAARAEAERLRELAWGMSRPV